VVSARWLFTFHGRLGRGRWWLAFVVQYIIVVVASLFAGLITPAGTGGGPPAGAPNVPAAFLMLAIFAVATWISLATSVKRLHDLGVSGWWIVPLLLWLMAGSAVSIAAPPSGLVGGVLMYIGLSMMLAPILYLGAVPGQAGENRFGSDPRSEGGQPDTSFNPGGDEPSNSQSGRVESFSDELRELQRLRDEGVISQDEFDRKKKQILGI